MKKKLLILCPGTKTILNKNSFGGHPEDYISDPADKTPISHNLRWVSVSESFKKTR